MDWFQHGSEIHLWMNHQGYPVCCLVRVGGGTKMLLVQRHSVSLLETEKSSPLVASLTGMKAVASILKGREWFLGASRSECPKEG